MEKTTDWSVLVRVDLDGERASGMEFEQKLGSKHGGTCLQSSAQELEAGRLEYKAVLNYIVSFTTA